MKGSLENLSDGKLIRSFRNLAWAAAINTPSEYQIHQGLFLILHALFFQVIEIHQLLKNGQHLHHRVVQANLKQFSSRESLEIHM